MSIEAKKTRDLLHWSVFMDLYTFYDAWTWYERHGAPVNCREFLDAAIRTNPTMMTLKEFLAPHTRVRGLARYRFESKTPEEAYPESDRPRGTEGDIDVIRSLMTGEREISPIVLVSHPTKRGKWLFLDGTHRLLAAHFLDPTHEIVIRVYYIVVERVQKKRTTECVIL
jgi:hypothetical protein